MSCDDHFGIQDISLHLLDRPTGSMRQVVLGTPFPKLVRVRCEWSQRPTERRRGGWRLITLPKRILM